MGKVGAPPRVVRFSVPAPKRVPFSAKLCPLETGGVTYDARVVAPRLGPGSTRQSWIQPGGSGLGKTKPERERGERSRPIIVDPLTSNRLLGTCSDGQPGGAVRARKSCGVDRERERCYKDERGEGGGGGLGKKKRLTTVIETPRSASTHLCFSPAARFPPPVPRRLSVWDDAGGLRPRIAPVRVRRRSARHHSVGDLELTLLGHIIPFSRRWAESDSGTDASGRDLCHGRRPPRPRRRRSARTTAVYASDQRADPDARDGLPRRSFTGKIRHRAKVRVRSPRTAAVRAEEVERMRAASRRKREEEVGRRGLERFAVVKCSCDPQRDFRESMVEMIWEKGLGRPEEMESLLACYLALNSDEHHDVIVKVFRQLWFELNLERLAHESNRRR
ncbi:hypothetical protein BHE74_00033645 [Ensete ventricosum]|nr:hypothetical protein BHE74_00033645 [Ensete ventricosum]